MAVPKYLFGPENKLLRMFALRPLKGHSAGQMETRSNLRGQIQLYLPTYE